MATWLSEFSMQGRERPQLRWYQSAYFWLAVLLPLVTAALCIWFVQMSFHGADETVRDDWYMDGKTLQQDLSRDRLAMSLGLNAVISLMPASHVNVRLVQITSDAKAPVFVPPKTLTLHFFHPAHAAKDLQTTLTLQPSGEYTGELPALNGLSGKYHTVLEDGKVWRLQKTVRYPQTKLSLEPLQRIL